ncbi:MAG: DUF4438 domain-containing protein [Lachnospiraceae bacterium]|nr:DUF4438 domain-containing protein [Lachnospiraceae bacterium]
MKTNEEKLPVLVVQGEVTPSKANSRGKMDTEGFTFYLPSTGGITLNVKIGDKATGWLSDHLEPGASTRNPVGELNNAYLAYSCIGNDAYVVSGDAKGAKGFVTGKHGGCDHVMIYFDDDTLRNLSIGDKIQVHSKGQGLSLIEHKDIVLRNLSPELLHKMNIKELSGKIKIGVSKIVPGALMSSGLGAVHSVMGDYDISLHDAALVSEYSLKDLRFGDIVAIMDSDSRHGHTYVSGAVTIGVVVHGDCYIPGHGPGVTCLMSAKNGLIEPFIDQNANLAKYFI